VSQWGRGDSKIGTKINNILDRKHALIFEISIFSDRKVNLVDTLGVKN